MAFSLLTVIRDHSPSDIHYQNLKIALYWTIILMIFIMLVNTKAQSKVFQRPNWRNFT